jgi:hypothetical protein
MNIGIQDRKLTTRGANELCATEFDQYTRVLPEIIDKRWHHTPYIDFAMVGHGFDEVHVWKYANRA